MRATCWMCMQAQLRNFTKALNLKHLRLRPGIVDKQKGGRTCPYADGCELTDEVAVYLGSEEGAREAGKW